MLTIERIKAELQDIQLSKVSAATGLHYNTLRDLRDNPDPNPTYRVMVAVSDYLENRANVKHV